VYVFDVPGRSSTFLVGCCRRSQVDVMTTEFDARPADDEVTVRACDACGHDLASHDAISSRYCRASLAGALDRGCVCPKAGKVGALAPAYG
jgi:hypothetical protein